MNLPETAPNANGTFLCKRCLTVFSNHATSVYEGVDGFMHHCPNCNNYLFTKAYKKAAAYALTADEIRYSIHSLTKQLAKVENARAQLYNAITKMEIMLEVAEEANNGN